MTAQVNQITVHQQNSYRGNFSFPKRNHQRDASTRRARQRWTDNVVQRDASTRRARKRWTGNVVRLHAKRPRVGWPEAPAAKQQQPTVGSSSRGSSSQEAAAKQQQPTTGSSSRGSSSKQAEAAAEAAAAEAAAAAKPAQKQMLQPAAAAPR